MCVEYRIVLVKMLSFRYGKYMAWRGWGKPVLLLGLKGGEIEAKVGISGVTIGFELVWDRTTLVQQLQENYVIKCCREWGKNQVEKCKNVLFTLG